jgi:hypothetical protein
MVSVRIVGAIGVTLAAMTGGAQASSFVVLSAPTSTPSIVMLGGPEPAKTAEDTKAGHDTSTPSIVVLGDPLPEVTYEKVAAIPDEKVAAIPDQPKSGRGFLQSPMVIRGGIVGGAFEAPAQPSAATAKASPAAAPATDTKAAPTEVASKSKPQPEAAPKPEPAAPQSEAIPVVEKPM